MTDHEQILRKAAVEIRAANINGWGNACEQGADRIRELEAALLKIDANILLDKYEYRRIAHAALASTLETKAEHVAGLNSAIDPEANTCTHPYSRRCDRCQKEMRFKEPCLADRFYCSFACAD